MDETNEFIHESVDGIKTLRRNAKHRQTNIIKRITALCHEKGSRTALRVHHQHLVSSQEELTRLSEALASKAPEEKADEYQREIDERVTACFKVVEDNIQSREGDASSICSTRSQASDVGSYASVISVRSGFELQRATTRREMAELELQAIVRRSTERLERLRLEEIQARKVHEENELRNDSEMIVNPNGEEIRSHFDITTVDPATSPYAHAPATVMREQQN